VSRKRFRSNRQRFAHLSALWRCICA
jgi:hypothetical protein